VTAVRRGESNAALRQCSIVAPCVDRISNLDKAVTIEYCQGVIRVATVGHSAQRVTANSRCEGLSRWSIT
jgi:hypothetical protein